MQTNRKIVITGASGYLAGLLASHFSTHDGYELVLISRSANAQRDISIADVGHWEESWTSLLQGAHTVVHLAGLRENSISWAQMQRANIDGTLNLFEAARLAKTDRVIFASTSWVLGGYFGTNTRLTPDLDPRPTSHYAVSKLAGESIARHYAERHGLSAICFRIGTCHKAEQDPMTIAYGRQQKWLSARDFCQAVQCAIETKGIDFATLNLTSRIEGSPWDISATERLLGYQPQDRHSPKQRPLHKRLAGRLKRVLRNKTNRPL